MAWYRCMNCRDYSRGLVGAFKEFEADLPRCPHCDQGGATIHLVPVHWLVEDAGGPIVGRGGLRWRLGCMPRREFLAADVRDTFSASGDARAVTCPSCRGLPQWREQMKAFPEFARLLIDPGGGCCG